VLPQSTGFGIGEHLDCTWIYEFRASCTTGSSTTDDFAEAALLPSNPTLFTTIHKPLNFGTSEAGSLALFVQ